MPQQRRAIYHGDAFQYQEMTMCGMRRWLLPLGLALAGLGSHDVKAQEFCGIDDIFNNGFETATFVPVTQLTGGNMSPGFVQSITGSGTLSVAIITSGSTSDAAVDIVGTFVGPTNTGISVNGFAGYTAGGQFLVPGVTLVSGSNALSATATILSGSTASNSGSITRATTVTPISVLPDRPIGYAPFAEHFAYSIGALGGAATITNVAINFKGTGGNDYSGSLAGAPTSFIYQQPGLYNAQFVFTDSNSIVYTIHRFVLIQDLDAQRGMLCDVYGYLKNRLTAQDATGASNVFQSSEQPTFMTFFSGLGTDMPSAATQLGSIVNGALGVGYADMLIVRDDMTNQVRTGYPMRMTQSADGVWRISDM